MIHRDINGHILWCMNIQRRLETTYSKNTKEKNMDGIEMSFTSIPALLSLFFLKVKLVF